MLSSSLGLLHLLGQNLSIAKIREMCEKQEVLGTQRILGSDLEVRIKFKDLTHYISDYNEYFVRYEVLDYGTLVGSSPYPRLAIMFPIERTEPARPAYMVPPLLLRATTPTEHGPDVVKFEIEDTDVGMIQFLAILYQVLQSLGATLLLPEYVTDDERVDLAREVLIGRLNRTPQILV